MNVRLLIVTMQIFINEIGTREWMLKILHYNSFTWEVDHFSFGNFTRRLPVEKDDLKRKCKRPVD